MRANRVALLIACACSVAALSACHRAGGRGPSALSPATPAGTGAWRSTAPARTESLEEYIARLRHLSGEARPAPPSTASVETSNPALQASLRRLAAAPTPLAYWQVGESYRRLGILDRAYNHLEQAVHLDPGYAPAWDALARVWRDWGTPEYGLGDATRAVYHAPNVAAYRNTLGTILVALGRLHEARGAFEAALTRDPEAAWAMNNLCYVDLQEGRLRDARSQCEAAVSRAPGFRAARENLLQALALISHPPTAAPGAPADRLRAGDTIEARPADRQNP